MMECTRPKMLRAPLISLFSAALFSASLCRAQGTAPIQLTVDLTDAPRKIIHAKLVIPVKSGEMTLVCPKWIPGEHGPTGPIDNIAGLVFRANGQDVPWRRDDVNMFAFHLTIPQGATKLDANVDFLATAAATGFSAGASTSVNLAMLSWNEVALYPAGIPNAQVIFAPSVKLPPEWKFGTALTQSSRDGDTVHFDRAPLEMLVDSPFLTGLYFKEIALAEDVTPKHYLDMAADGPEDLNISAEQQKSFSNLVRETGALYASRHYGSYHFLLTLSDQVAHFGLEHHQSSDDRVEARNFLDDDLAMLNGDLLPHEFTHSWNGKYRRPAGLATATYMEPMKGELLWVYEGLTQYLGDVLSARSGIWTAEQYRSYLAASAAELDHRPGRTWRTLQDTATAAQILYGASEQWDSWRRSVDYYQEGELVWLEVDTTIRKLSHGKKSLNNFCAAFLGLGGNTAPKVVPYRLDDIVENLNAVQAYDWAALLKERLTSKSPHAPLGGVNTGGYRIEYTDQENEFNKAGETRDRAVNAWYSLGIRVADSAISDVLIGSIGYQAGLGPGMKMIAVNGRRYSEEILHRAIRESKDKADPIELIVENTGFVKVVKLDYHGGEKYPHLVRDSGQAASLDEILKPLTAAKLEKSADKKDE